MTLQLGSDFETKFDLFDHRQTQNMWAVTTRWRRDTPVVRLPGGFTYVARWADCWRILRDPAIFENGNSFKAVEMPDQERMLGEMDPPRHPRLRRVIRGAFGRNAVEVEREFASASSRALLDQWGPGDEIDLVSRFTDQISNQVSLHHLGFPLDDCEQVVEWVRELLHSDWPALNRTERGEGMGGAFPEFSAYIDAMVDSRRGENAPDDIVGRLVRCELDGEALSTTVLRILTANFVLGGISTTTNLIASLLWRILQSPELHAELRAEPELIAAAVEETLRLDPPVLFVMRVCRTATEVAGTLLEPGEKIVVGVASANRDERVFESPDEFRLDRGLAEHLSFGGGAHHCVGSGLARVVAVEAVAAFVRRFDVDEIRVAPGFEYEGVPVFLEHGPVRLDVELVAEQG